MLAWPDLVLDLVMLPDSPAIMVDDDEIDASGFRTTAPWLVDQMFDARDELFQLFKSVFFPTQ